MEMFLRRVQSFVILVVILSLPDQTERQELERDRKKKKKFDTDDGAEKEDALPELLPPASLTVCSSTMDNMTVFKVREDQTQDLC